MQTRTVEQTVAVPVSQTQGCLPGHPAGARATAHLQIEAMDDPVIMQVKVPAVQVAQKIIKDPQTQSINKVMDIPVVQSMNTVVDVPVVVQH